MSEPQDTTKAACGRSDSTEVLAVTGYYSLDRELWGGLLDKWQAEDMCRWLEAEEATGRIALLSDEANYRAAKAEQVALSAISKAMANP